MFTHRHYEKVAEVLRDSVRFVSNEERKWHHKVTDNFIEMFKHDNEKFKESRFITAIYGGDKK